MANLILTKNSTTGDNVPSTSECVVSEIGANTTDGKLYLGTDLAGAGHSSPGDDSTEVSWVGAVIKDEDDFASDSDDVLATQQSIKAYVDYSQYIRHIMNVGWYSSDGNKDYLPLVGYTLEQGTVASMNEYIGFVAPYDGLLDKVIVRCESACGSSIVGFHKSPAGIESPSTTATEAITVDMSVDDTGYDFNFTGTASFSKGNILAISFDPTSKPYDTIATIVWKFDTTT